MFIRIPFHFFSCDEANWKQTIHKNWSKKVTNLNPEGRGGYCFVGSWLDQGEESELKEGDIVLTFSSYDASAYNHGYKIIAKLFKVTNGNLELVVQSGGKSWANTLMTAFKKHHR